MTPERWEQIKALFESALGKPLSERHAFLELACPNDAELRSEVESILADYDGTGSFLEKPLLQPDAAISGRELVGRTVSHYRIVAKLGEGGMGVVYRAEDTRLGRHVALKFLPERVSRHPEALERFRREARTASALNHPHICALYDVGPDESPFLVMELLEGETLQKRLARQPVTLLELMQVASQITDALTAAHAKGIVHRDLKPGNIFLTPQRGVKVLDFGLAKLVEPLGYLQARPLESERSTVVIEDQALTIPGTALGTIAYMSPEQALGADVDARTDLFSCGVVLYEMATGNRPFQGPTQAALFDAILHQTPVGPRSLNPELPGKLERVIEKALEKDRELRYQSAADLRTDLKRVERVLSFSTHRPVGTEAKQNRVRSFPFWAAAAIAMMALAALIGGGVYHWASTDTKPFKTMKITRLTTSGKVTRAAISPDGRYVVHTISDSGSESLWVRHIDTASNVQIVGPAKAHYEGLTFSRDGNFVYYIRSENNSGLGILYELPVLGGASRKVVIDIDSPVSVSPDGNKGAFVRRSPGGGSAVIIADIHSGVEQKLGERQGNSFFSGVSWSPDGSFIACSGATFNPAYATVVAIPVTGGAERQITLHKWFAIRSVAWMPAGRGLVLTAADESSDASSQIWYVRYPSGETRHITNDLNYYETLSIPADSSAIISVQYDVHSSLWITQIRKTAAALQITSGAGWDGVFGLSCTADGRIIYSSNSVGRIDLLAIALTGGYARQLTSAARSNVYPRASRDGRYLVFGSNRSGLMHLWIMDSDGSNPKQLTQGNKLENLPDLSPDGHWIVYSTIDPSRLCKMSLQGGKPISLTERSGFRASVSPDGKLIAYYDDSEVLPRPGIAIIPFEGGPPIRRFDIWRQSFFLPLNSVHWTPDSRNLLYVEDRAGVSNIYRQALAGGPATEVTDFKQDQIFNFDPCPDGRQLAFDNLIWPTFDTLIWPTLSC